MKHWTSTYASHAEIIYEVDADVYQNPSLTKAELAVADGLLAEEGILYASPHLDLACGTGRHSIALASRGLAVVAVDYSPGFLEMAEGLARKAGVGVVFKQGDLRDLGVTVNPTDRFASVTLLGNSFGFFDDEGNRQILHEIRRVLCRGGPFVFDACDKATYVPLVQPYSQCVVKTPSFGTVRDERWRKWDPCAGTLLCRKRHTSEECGVLLDTEYSLRLYDREELCALLGDAGFRCVTTTQYRSGTELGAMSSRVFYLAK